MTVRGREALDELCARLGPAARLDEPIARYTSLRVGGRADAFLIARSNERLMAAIDAAEQLRVKWQVIGGASNLLVADDGIEGLIVKTAPGPIELERSDGRCTSVRASGGCLLAAVAKQSAFAGASGLEWAVNVPGTVGAAVVNNAGAFGSATSEHLLSAEMYEPFGRTRHLTVDDLRLGYRTSALKRGELHAAVLTASFRLGDGEPELLRAHVANIQRTRKLTQPSGFSIGSIFANPPGDAAGRLIDSAGLKGQTIGNAKISDLHANFILNLGMATASDVYRLMRHIQITVHEHHGVWLYPEVQLIGRWPRAAVEALNAPDKLPIGVPS